MTNGEEDEHSAALVEKSKQAKAGQDFFKPLRELFKKLSKDSKEPFTDDNLEGKGFGELRDVLLAFNPMNGHHVETVNKAEAEFWKQREGYQVLPSDDGSFALLSRNHIFLAIR